MAGAGLLIALTQVPTVLGLQSAGSGADPFLVRLWLTCCRGGPIPAAPLVIGLGTAAVVAGLNWSSGRLKVKLPAVLLSLIAVSALVALVDLGPAGGRVGWLNVERQFPTLQMPVAPGGWLAQLRAIGLGAPAIALVGLVEALAMARALAEWSGQPLDYNHQCLAEGLANIGGGLFGCLPGSGSLSRSTLNYHAGAATRLSGVFSAASVAAALYLFAPLARFVPQSALAGVLLWTAWHIIEPRRLWHRLRSSRREAVIVLSTASTAIVVGIEFAVLAGISSSVLLRWLGSLTPASPAPVLPDGVRRGGGRSTGRGLVVVAAEPGESRPEGGVDAGPGSGILKGGDPGRSGGVAVWLGETRAK
jgi:SulP family sulfate permease